MLAAAEDLEFERAAQLRDKIAELKGEKVASPQVKGKKGRKGSKFGKGNGGNAGPAKPQGKGGGRPPRPRASGA